MFRKTDYLCIASKSYSSVCLLKLLKDYRTTKMDVPFNSSTPIKNTANTLVHNLEIIFGLLITFTFKYIYKLIYIYD